MSAWLPFNRPRYGSKVDTHFTDLGWELKKVEPEGEPPVEPDSDFKFLVDSEDVPDGDLRALHH